MLIGWFVVIGLFDWLVFIFFLFVFLWMLFYYWLLFMKYKDDYEDVDVLMFGVICNVL